MKTKITFLIAIAIVSFGQVFAQTVEVKPDYYDAWVSYNGADGVTAVNPYGDNLLINNGTGITPTTTKLNCAVMNFLLPSIPAGTQLVSASFTATSVRKDAGVNSNGDLYGINFRTADVALGTDFYAGAFTAGPNVGNGSDWGIMDNMFAITDPSGTAVITTKTTDATANLQLLAFIQKQYQDGGVNKYAFLRLSLDNLASAAWQRYSIASEANATYYPRLTLTFSVGTSVDIIAGSHFVCYANQNGNIVVEGENLKGNTMNVYSLIGKLISSENIAENHFTSKKSLSQGNYLVKINGKSGSTFSQIILVK